MLRAYSRLPFSEIGNRIPFDVAVLSHDERRLRRKLVTLVHGDQIMVDLAATTTFDSGDCLLLEDGRLAQIIAGEEPLYEIIARNPLHLTQLAWHLGNRHLPVQIEAEGDAPRIVILRDHVIRDMLKKLGAEIREIVEPFSPLNGAYHDHSHGEASHALLYRK
jgi:urease accessory protein